MVQLLESKANPFGGMVVVPTALPPGPIEFADRLDRSLQEWRNEGLKAVWLEVPIAHSALIPVAVNNGFTFHHSGDDYLMLTYGCTGTSTWRTAPTSRRSRPTTSA